MIQQPFGHGGVVIVAAALGAEQDEARRSVRPNCADHGQGLIAHVRAGRGVGAGQQLERIVVAQILARDRIRLRVWERGAGETKACGTGACAALVAAARRGLTGRQAVVTLDGGELFIDWRERDDHVLMTGPVAVEFTGALP